jgi:hypothetical protein
MCAQRMERPIGDRSGTVQSRTIQVIHEFGIIGQPRQARMRACSIKDLLAIDSPEVQARKGILAIEVRVKKLNSGIGVEKGTQLRIGGDEDRIVHRRKLVFKQTKIHPRRAGAGPRGSCVTRFRAAALEANYFCSSTKDC